MYYKKNVHYCVHKSQHVVPSSGVSWRGLGGTNSHPPPEIPKALQYSAKLNSILKIVKNCWIWDPNTPRYSKKKGSKILKLPQVRNCFTLAMTNKLVVIINSLKVPKIKKILLYEISCTKLQPSPETLTRGLPPPDPRSVHCPQPNLLNPSPSKIPGFLVPSYSRLQNPW